MDTTIVHCVKNVLIFEIKFNSFFRHRCECNSWHSWLRIVDVNTTKFNSDFLMTAFLLHISCPIIFIFISFRLVSFWNKYENLASLQCTNVFNSPTTILHCSWHGHLTSNQLAQFIIWMHKDAVNIYYISDILRSFISCFHVFHVFHAVLYVYFELISCSVWHDIFSIKPKCSNIWHTHCASTANVRHFSSFVLIFSFNDI